jgi:ribosome-associated protein
MHAGYTTSHSRLGNDAPVAGVVLGPGVAVPNDRLEFSFVSSSGPGGQNVNKRATKCQLRVRMADLGLRPEQAERLASLAGSMITVDSELILSCDAYRSQERNKAEVLAKLREIVLRAMVKPKRRIATKPSRGARERRLTEKKATGAIKRLRSGPVD